MSGLGDFLCPEGYAGPRGVRALAGEGSLALEIARGRRRSRADRRARAGLPWARAGRLPVSEPVLLVPGFMAGDWSLRLMARSLREEGFRTYRSGIAINARCTLEAATRLEERVAAIAARRGGPVTVVGHSLGGMLARGLAARRPDLVAGIVTMGSPVLAPGAVHRVLGLNTQALSRLAAAGLPGPMSRDCVGGECARASWAQAQEPLPEGFGFTAVYSRRDGIVDWRSCLDPAATHVEVRCSHVGMAVDPAVLDAVVSALRGQRASRLEQLAAEAPELIGRSALA